MPFYLFVFTLHNFISFSCLIAMARTSNTLLNRSDMSIPPLSWGGCISVFAHSNNYGAELLTFELENLSAPENYRFHL